MHFLHRFEHVLVRFLHGIEFLLLRACQERTNLRNRAFDHRFHLLHRILMDGGDLRFRLIDNRPDFRLLIRREAKALGQVLERVGVHSVYPGAATARPVALRVNGECSERQCACDDQ